MVGIAIVLLLYGLLIYKGIQIALRAPDRYGTYLAFGLTLVIGLQALINSAVVMGLLPTKGLPLPFISYGGSSLLTNLAAMGILMNISSYTKEQSRGWYTGNWLNPQTRRRRSKRNA
jgi:cell division protein FtsW